MFKNDDEFKPSPASSAHSQEVETIIGPSVRVEGNFKGDGNLKVDGEVKGSIKTKGDVRVGERAKIKASVEATNAVIAGEVQGNIKTKEKLELMASAKVVGDISAKSLQINDGAKLNGTIKMEDESLVQELISKPKPALNNSESSDKTSKKTKKK